MGKKLYVGNLPYTANQQTLQDMFSKCGTVDSVNVITDRDTGQSKGFAFVEMPSKMEAEAAITGLKGKTLKERTMDINEARPRTDSRGGRSSYGGGGRRGGGFGGGGRGGGRQRRY